MEVFGLLGFIIGCAAAVLAVLGWGAAGGAIGRIKRLETDLEELKVRVERLERQ